MKYNKIIFLDVDGVINIPPYLQFDKRCLDNLRKIVKATGGKIIVSSSWRTGNLELTKEALMEAGFYDDLLTEIIGETVRKYSFTKEGSYLKVVRGNEIGTWVDRNLKYPWHDSPELQDQYTILKSDGMIQGMRSNVVGKDYSYVILDDDNDMLLCQKDYFVHTESLNGISDIDVEKAIQILNKIDNIKPIKETTTPGIYLRKRTHE